MSDYEFKNEVSIQGIIIDKVKSNGSSAVRIAADKYLTKGELRQNYPKVFFLGKNESLLEDYKVGDNVKVSGYIQSSKRVIKGHNTITQKIICESIMVAPRIINEDDIITGTKYEAPHNNVRLAGTVAEIHSPKKGLILMRVFSEKDGKRSGVLFGYHTDVDKVMSEIKKGDYVYMIGYVATSKGDDSSKKSTENIVAREVVKIDNKNS